MARRKSGFSQLFMLDDHPYSLIAELLGLR